MPIALDYAPSIQDFEVGLKSCFPFNVGLADKAGLRLTLNGFLFEFILTWHGGALPLTSVNGRLTIVQDVNNFDVVTGEITASEIGALPLGARTHYSWTATIPGECPFEFGVGNFIVIR